MMISRILKSGFVLLGLAGFFLSSTPALAATLCCKCAKGASNYCVNNITDVGSCADVALGSAELNKIKSGNEDAFTGFGCTETLSDTDCRTIDQSGRCTEAPTSLQGLLPVLKKSIQDDQPARIIESSPPILGVPIPDLTFGKVRQEGEYLVIPYLAQYISAAYRYLIGASVIAAIIMVMYGGFRYTVGAAIGDAKAGKSIIKDAVMGLIILLGAYVILETINPATLNLTALRIPLVEKVELEEEGDVNPNPQPVEESTQSDGTACTEPGKACSDVESCKTLCAKSESERPKCSPNVADPSAVRTIPSGDGVLNTSGAKATPAVLAAIKKAGQAAEAQGYSIVITSGYRLFSKQIELVCSKVKSGKQKEIDKIGHSVAYPGGSNHGSGKALDVQLRKGNDILVCSGCWEPQNQSKYKVPAEVLAKIMTDAGFQRLSSEIWHFELGTSNSCRCQYPNCPFPPTC